MSRTRRVLGPALKAKVALAALKGTRRRRSWRPSSACNRGVTWQKTRLANNVCITPF
jgi:hypothetical protein